MWCYINFRRISEAQPSQKFVYYRKLKESLRIGIVERYNNWHNI